MRLTMSSTCYRFLQKPIDFRQKTISARKSTEYAPHIFELLIVSSTLSPSNL